MQSRERVIRLLLRLLSYPYRFTRRELAEHFGVSKDTIDDDIEELKKANIKFDQEQGQHYRCAVLPNKEFDELRHLQALSEVDRARIGGLLDRYLSGKEALYLKNKLSSLYDFQRLGIRALRQPKLEIIDRLEAAKKQQRLVILEAYRSRNSNRTRDRQVEPFDVNPELDTLQAFDVEKKENRHFLLSRMQRVRIMETPWKFATYHRKFPTDVFRIVDSDPVQVHLELDVFAYTDLIERYPQAKAYIEPGAEPDTFDFQCPVNHRFYGLVNFIMSNAGHVTIFGPEALRTSVREEAEKLLKSLNPPEEVGSAIIEKKL